MILFNMKCLSTGNRGGTRRRLFPLPHQLGAPGEAGPAAGALRVSVPRTRSSSFQSPDPLLQESSSEPRITISGAFFLEVFIWIEDTISKTFSRGAIFCIADTFSRILHFADHSSLGLSERLRKKCMVHFLLVALN